MRVLDSAGAAAWGSLGGVGPGGEGGPGGGGGGGGAAPQGAQALHEDPIVRLLRELQGMNGGGAASTWESAPFPCCVGCLGAGLPQRIETSGATCAPTRGNAPMHARCLGAGMLQRRAATSRLTCAPTRARRVKTGGRRGFCTAVCEGGISMPPISRTPTHCAFKCIEVYLQLSRACASVCTCGGAVAPALAPHHRHLPGRGRACKSPSMLKKRWRNR